MTYVRDTSSDFFFPKTEKEILVENLDTKHGILEKFFSESAPKILESGNLSKKEKESLINAMSASIETSSTIKSLETITAGDKSITKTIIEKALNLLPQTAPPPDPIHIPPQCRLECSNQ
ncbi:MAG: hypothetical protein A3J46_04280 [Candidatus Yanofskybacteria bacterium RIFCSPHIGHO2_02_FULL_41_11]|uniref:Uncharacterized protein n=1 Tax=Candidatus Yanofskybacteria bacterium RIFCSPHIGHO2_02_FULL_41_11 TaxID=1802675 RepID=A0A1F8F939_9BACT|nr:MAG: hypothetical protein A3J46_04280 [Candidatus Yanofskybacteria bacterium RIFCSPHIGHO2_02_FULL_41_11]